MENRSRKDTNISKVIKFSGISVILFVSLIFIFLLVRGLPALTEVSFETLVGKRWYPTEGYYGLLPLIGGSILVTVGATLFAVPFGVTTAIYISEIAPSRARSFLKPIIEILAGLPSVVLGFLGITLLSPFLREFFNLPTGLSALSGAILLGSISIPTIVSVAEDAIDAVPKAYRDAAYALGATKWETIWTVTLPAAKSGVITAVMLGIARSMGETMTVMMVTGNAAVLPTGLGSLLSPVRTMTATIAAEMGEVANGSVHFHVLFLIGIVLFLISLLINLIATSVVSKQTTKSEKILS
jgi:phosphate transport system permease protein